MSWINNFGPHPHFHAEETITLAMPVEASVAACHAVVDAQGWKPARVRAKDESHPTDFKVMGSGLRRPPLANYEVQFLFAGEAQGPTTVTLRASSPAIGGRGVLEKNRARFLSTVSALRSGIEQAGTAGAAPTA